MPTKPNRAGQQQNYVPPGNGDASGEYADEATGSNIHFVNFKKPDEDNNSSEQNTIKGFESFSKGKGEETQVEKIEDTKKDLEKNMISRFTVLSRDETAHVQTFIEKLTDDLNDDGLQKLNNYLSENQKLKMKLGGSGRNAAGCAWDYSQINLDDTNPHVIKHELGHTFDNFYGKDLPLDPQHKTFYDSDYASNRFVDPETNKTLNEMLHNELGIHNVKAIFSWSGGIRFYKEAKDSSKVKNESMKKIADIYTKYCDKVLDETTGVPNARNKIIELEQEKKNVNNEIANLIVQTEQGNNYNDALQAVRNAENEYRNEVYRRGGFSVYYDDSPKVRQARLLRDAAKAKVDALAKEMFNQRFSTEKQNMLDNLKTQKYQTYKKLRGVAGIVGDVADYMNVYSQTPFDVNGHGNGYFKNRGDGGFSLEIFANMYDAYMSKNPLQRECVKEMFPQSIKIFEKIYNKQFK